MWTQIAGVCLAILGLLGTILICGLPMWQMSAFIGANIVTAQVYWRGLWMNCVIQSTGHSQCLPYQSLLALPKELQISMVLICVSIAVSVVAIGLTLVGVRCTNFCRHNWRSKANYGRAGAAMFILAGLVCLVPVSWSAYTIITGFYNPLTAPGGSGELGPCIYVGWISGVLQVIGGGVLCSTYGCC
ncbi:claudin-4-like isoform X2 [Micropterus salmoides]|uniref:claudin-4-like isoform X2 n=1 Tax=Micropterus salmoides TaxID=27706 RepID=UPI0018ECDD7B|nr:claudin-4-like isoform X2 [Micropterus salmoides]